MARDNMSAHKRIFRSALGALAGLVVILLTIWAALALWISGPGGETLRIALGAGFALCGVLVLASLFSARRRVAGLVGFALLYLAFVVWWQGLQPSNERQWNPPVARLAHAEINGDLVTVRNIRNFDYRTETDFTPGYYDRTFDLRQLESVDMVAVYWMGPAIAHTFLSFGFADGNYLAVSIETRTEVGEGYSTLKGFFKQYELYYVVADERDVIRVRTNYRKDPPEDAYVYRIHGKPENLRRVFMSYIDRINQLKAAPEFYNTLLDNCTTGIWMNARVNPGRLPLSWKVLASGYVPQYLYESGRLDTSLPFEQLQSQVHINARAQAADSATDFSRRIRAGLPGIDAKAK